MARATARYIIDRAGRKKAVVLDLSEYRRLLQRLEELEDALDLDKAVKGTQEFTDYQEVRKALKGEGRL